MNPLRHKAVTKVTTVTTYLIKDAPYVFRTEMKRGGLPVTEVTLVTGNQMKKVEPHSE